MRVLALMTEAFGALGGIQQYSRDYLRALAACPEVSAIDALVRRPRYRGPLPPGVRQWTPWGGKPGYLATALALALTRRPQVVVCAHLNLAPVALWVARLSGAPVWLHVYGVEAWQRPGRAAQRLAERAALVTAISRDTRARTASWAGTAPERLRILAPTVSAKFSPGEVVPRAFPGHDWQGKRLILSVGRLSSQEAYKGQDRVIQALPILLKDDPGLRYLIVGEGDDLPRLRALAASCGVAAEVCFLGRRSDQELLALYRMADLFVLASAGEGFGIVYLEAMACGCPALGLDQGGAVDALLGNPLGHVCDEASLLQAMRSILAQGHRHGRQSAASAFAWPAFCAQVQRLLCRLVQERLYG